MRLLLYLFVAVALAEASRKRFKFKNSAVGETYAVLIAGSNGWYNYRHQADVAHAYHTLRNHGIPQDNIIVMMYDDVANATQNPYPGKLYNIPHGPDVYKGLKIDYKTTDVTVANFVSVLKGEADKVKGGNKRVLKSTSKDRVFIYFTDHGATGLISFPDEMMTVKTLNEVLRWMYDNKKYSELVFYLEACESGSMFEKVLPDNINIYAITAANGHESSWGTYCENDMKLPCLGDLFSVNWMVDTDDEDIDVETLQHQYELVKQKTTKSHVLQFGDVDIGKEPVANFQGEKPSKQTYKSTHKKLYLDTQAATSWQSRDIELKSLLNERATANDIHYIASVNKRIDDIYEARRKAKRTVHNLVKNLVTDKTDLQSILEEHHSVHDIHCHHDVVTLFNDICINLSQNEHAMKYVYVLNNLCIHFKGSTEILDGIYRMCDNQSFEFFALD